jgi:integrase
MSIHRVTDPAGKVVSYRVKWRDYAGVAHSKNFPKGSKNHADALDAAIRAAKAKGEEMPSDAQPHAKVGVTLAAWGIEYRKRVLGSGQVSKRVLADRRPLWNRYVLDRDQAGYGIGHLPIRAIDKPRIMQFRDELVAANVAPHSIKATLKMLGSMFSEAIEAKLVLTNPVNGVKFKLPTKAGLKPFPPIALEWLQVELLARGENRSSLLTRRDASLVAVIGYAGLRPAEALHLRWHDIEDTRITVRGSLVDGEETGGKTGDRRVPLRPPLAEVLGGYRKALGKVSENDLLFPMKGKQPFSETAYNNWHKRHFDEALREVVAKQQQFAPLAGNTVYRLRGSAASLWIMEGQPLSTVAKWMGHSVATLLKHYTASIEHLEDNGPVEGNKLISAARAKVAQEHADALAAAEAEQKLADEAQDLAA